jgi:hypothetical protein
MKSHYKLIAQRKADNASDINPCEHLLYRQLIPNRTTFESDDFSFYCETLNHKRLKKKKCKEM